MTERAPRRFFDRRKTIVAVGSVAAGLASLGAAAFEVHRRQKARPESLLDERAATYKNGAVLKTAAVLLGGPVLMGRQEIETKSGLLQHQAGNGLAFLVESGLAVKERFTNTLGNREDIYMLGHALPDAILEDEVAYAHVVRATAAVYEGFTVEALKQRFGTSGSL